MTTQDCSAKLSHPKGAIVHRFTLALALGVLTSGCSMSESNNEEVDYSSQIAALAGDQEPTDPLAKSQRRGRVVYEHYCLICHGTSGQGDGFNASMLDTPPRNFSEEAFWKQVDEEHLIAVVSRGGQAVNKSVLMPAWGHTLSEQQIDDTIAYLRTAPKLAKLAKIKEAAEEAIEEEADD